MLKFYLVMEKEEAMGLWVFYNYGKLARLYHVASSVQGRFLEIYETERPFKLI